VQYNRGGGIGIKHRGKGEWYKGEEVREDREVIIVDARGVKHYKGA
jgi:hypothetical protein